VSLTFVDVSGDGRASTVTFGGIVSRTTLSNFSVLFPDLSFATTTISFSPSISVTSAENLPSASTVASTPFTRTVGTPALSVAIPVIVTVGLLVGDTGLSTESSGAIVSAPTTTTVFPGTYPSFVAVISISPASVGLTKNFTTPSASVTPAKSTPAP